MGFFDKVKAFAGGKGMATVEVVEVSGQAPAGVAVAISDTTLAGVMKVTADKACTLLATKAEVVLRTEKDGVWSNVTVASGKVEQVRELAVGDVITAPWSIAEVDIDQYLRNQSFDDVNTAVGNPKVKLIVNCIADVKGSPFDPSAEAEVRLAPSTAAPVSVAITVIEGQAPADANFPVTDSVLKGTVVVTGRSATTLATTRYEVVVHVDGKDVVVAKNQHPEIKKEGLAGLSVSFGGTNIEFPKKLGRGDKATQTWMISDIDIPAALAAQGHADAAAAVSEGKATLSVVCHADVTGGAISTTSVPVMLTSS